MDRIDEPGESVETAPFTEAELIRGIADRLAGQDFQAEADPSIGLLRPDLVIRDSEGPVAVVEVKREAGPIHFASLSQVAAYSTELAKVAGRSVYPALISTGELSEELVPLAESLEVGVVSVNKLDLAGAVDLGAGKLMELLQDQPPQALSVLEEPTEWDQLFEELTALLEKGESRYEIARQLRLNKRELVTLYTELLPKLEAKDPDRLDLIMRTWERRA